MPAPTSAPDALRRLQLIWGVVPLFVALATVALGVLAAGRTGAPPAAEWAGPVFYANALLNLGAHLIALAAFRRLPGRIAAAPDVETAIDETRRTGLPALAALELGAFAAISAAYVTGEQVNLAFLIPFFGLAAWFFPSRGRVGRWRSGK